MTLRPCLTPLKLVTVFISLLLPATYSGAKPPWVKLRTGRLTAHEVRLLNKLHAYNTDFVFNKRVNRYYSVNAYGQEILFASEIVFDKQNGLAIKVDGAVTLNIAYEISFVNWGIGEGDPADGLMVTYFYTIGRLSMCEGVAIVDDHQIIDTSCSCRLNGDCSSETRRNGVLLSAASKAKAKRLATPHHMRQSNGRYQVQKPKTP